MNTYRMKPEAYEKIRRRLLLMIPPGLALVAAGVAYALPANHFNAWIIFIASALVLSACSIGLYRGMRRIRETLPTFALTLGEDFILRTQSHYPDIRIERGEITAIKKAINGDMVVKTRKPWKFILIPASLEHLDEIEATLSAWKPIKVVSKLQLIGALALGLAVFVGALATLRYTLVTFRPSIVTLTALLFVALVLLAVLLAALRLHIDRRAVSRRRLIVLGAGMLWLFAVCGLLGLWHGCP